MPISRRCSPVRCEYAPEMASLTQPDTVPFFALWKDSLEEINKAFLDPQRGFVRLRYHFKALTGQCTLSSGEKSFKLSKNTELRVKEADWFLSYRRDGSRWAPPFPHRRWPSSILQEWTQLTLLADASCKRKAVLTANDLRGAVCNGSNGAPARYFNTVGKSHVSVRVLGLADTTKRPFSSDERSALEDTVEPSGKPWCTAAIADLYHAIVLGAKGLLLCQAACKPLMNSATSVRGAWAGSTLLSTHHLRKWKISES